MKYCFIQTILVIIQATSVNVANGFRAGNDGNQDLMKRAIEDSLLNIAEPKQPPVVDDHAPPLRNEILDTEVPCLYEYWSRPDIHTFGNMGFGGALHAAIAPVATKLIDVKAYGGQDVRKMIAEELRVLVDKSGARVCDLCCGVGISTRALEKAFHDAESIVGVDTSLEMLSMAKAISDHEQGIRNLLGQTFKGITNSMTAYKLANAENTALSKGYDLVTIFYAFHEIPKEARSRIIQEARRILALGGTLAVVDISPMYQPSSYMLAGEPFVIEYQQNIDDQLASSPKFKFLKRKEIVPGHVNMWLLTAN